MGIREADDLRRWADRRRSETLEALEQYEERAFPVVSGGPRGFTRERPEDRAALQGLAVLRQSVDDVAAALYVLAEGIENEIMPPSEVLRLLDLQTYYREWTEGQTASEQGRSSNGGNPPVQTQ